MRRSFVAAALVVGAGLAGCSANDRAVGAADALRSNQATISPDAANGGGQRTLHDVPSVGITTGGGAPVRNRMGSGI